MASDLRMKIEWAKTRLEKTLQLATEIDDVDNKELEQQCAAITASICKTDEITKAHTQALNKAQAVENVKDFDAAYSGEFRTNQVPDIQLTQGYKDMMAFAGVYLTSKTMDKAGSSTNTNVIDGKTSLRLES